jgi:RHS repeat-associated protein
MGQAVRVSAAQAINADAAQALNTAASQAGNPAWQASMQRNELGQEIERMLPGNVISSWQYDPIGRPEQHRISSGQATARRRSYDWDINDRLKKITNGLTGTSIVYDYDEFSNLIRSHIASEYSKYDYIYRSVDDVGNIYETEEKTDRIYDVGSRLKHTNINIKELKAKSKGGQGGLVTKGTEFAHDAEGNLAKKTDANGDVWRYEYYGNGMLSKVIKPDGSEVTFKYDPLGRRIEIQTPQATKKFVWDSNNPLHEWVDKEGKKDNEVKGGNESNIVTWVFDDGFVPTAKLTNDGSYSIVSDHLGTPVEAYDVDGECVWSAELDIYGRVVKFTGEEDFVPFRYQGQYADVETGLYYNRSRYYDPVSGQYTQQDPIGLAGGNPTFYAYVSDTNFWIDPLGLSSQLHHTIPRQIYNPRSGKDPLIPKHLANLPEIRGCRGNPNRWAIPKDIHVDLHKSNRPGGSFNSRWVEEIKDLRKVKPDIDTWTKENILDIRDKIVKEFNIEKYKPTPNSTTVCRS